MTLEERQVAPPPLPPSASKLPCLVLLLLLLLLGAGIAGFLLLSRPRLRFTNRLSAPVRLAVEPRSPRTVAPGETISFLVPAKRALLVEWEVQRPLSADSTPMGEIVRGSLVERSPRGTIRVVATTRSGSAAYFAPLITNGSSRPLRITVNAGLQGALDCGCAVRPGGRRVFIGYYRLYRNSTVQARAGSAKATFRDLGPQVTSETGVLGLRFNEQDLR